MLLEEDEKLFVSSWLFSFGGAGNIIDLILGVFGVLIFKVVLFSFLAVRRMGFEAWMAIGAKGLQGAASGNSMLWRWRKNEYVG